VVLGTGKPVGFFVVEHLVHEWEHFGMMEYVKGLYDVTYPGQVPAKKPARDRLPGVCPHCGETISAETVTWFGQAEAKCPHCHTFIAIG